VRQVEPATEVLNAKKLQELLSQIDPREKLDEDVEVLLRFSSGDWQQRLVVVCCFFFPRV
jgi:hypothetical protein